MWNRIPLSDSKCQHTEERRAEASRNNTEVNGNTAPLKIFMSHAKNASCLFSFLEMNPTRIFQVGFSENKQTNKQKNV